MSDSRPFRRESVSALTENFAERYNSLHAIGGNNFPDDTPYTVKVVARQYDYYADCPNDLSNDTAKKNRNAAQAVGGKGELNSAHANYSNIGLSDPGNKIFAEGNATYILGAPAKNFLPVVTRNGRPTRRKSSRTRNCVPSWSRPTPGRWERHPRRPHRSKCQSRDIGGFDTRNRTPNVYGLVVPSMDRRSAMLMFGVGVAAAALPLPKAGAQPGIGDTPPGPGVPTAAEPGPNFLFAEEFNGPAGAPPDPAWWFIVPARETIKNPVEWDKPYNMGRYVTDQEHVFQDGAGNLVIRATRGEGANIQEKYASAKIIGNWRGGVGTTWEARVKLNCLTDGAWPAFWLLNDNPVRGGEVDLIEWYGNRDWPSGTTVHARLDGTSFQTDKHPVDGDWHTWRMTWKPEGMYFWKDYQPGMQPFFTVLASSLPDWPFNDPGYTLAPVFNIAVGGSGGREPAGGNYPAEMLIDWIRVF